MISNLLNNPVCLRCSLMGFRVFIVFFLFSVNHLPFCLFEIASSNIPCLCESSISIYVEFPVGTKNVAYSICHPFFLLIWNCFFFLYILIATEFNAPLIAQMKFLWEFFHASYILFDLVNCFQHNGNLYFNCDAIYIIYTRKWIK